MSEKEPYNGLRSHVQTLDCVRLHCDAATFSQKYLGELVWEMNWSISGTERRDALIEQLTAERDALLLRVAELEAGR